jgi:hypothetical protein
VLVDTAVNHETADTLQPVWGQWPETRTSGTRIRCATHSSGYRKLELAKILLHLRSYCRSLTGQKVDHGPDTSSVLLCNPVNRQSSIGQLKCDGTRGETRFRLSAKRTSPFKSAGASVQSTTGSRGVRISGSNAGYTKFRGSAKSTGYPLHSPVSPSLLLPCVTVCHHISTEV